MHDAADPPLILDISIHAPDAEKDKPYGSHSRILETSVPPNVVKILDAEFEDRRGRIMVSLCADTAITDKARKHVREKKNKWVRLVELDFQPSLWETGRLFSSDMDFQCEG